MKQLKCIVRLIGIGNSEMEKIKDFTTKYRKILYIIAAAVIIIISCYFGFQGQENWTSEKYGTTCDGQITIENNTVLKEEFEIEHNDFKGVMIRISNKTRKYENEKLHFYLYDDSNNLISDYVMVLKNEMYNVDAFAPLPYKNSKGKKVDLYIIGENIKKIPKLYISNNESLKSDLYVDNSPKDYSLVLSVAYMEYNINYSFLVGGIILIFMLFISFLWKINSESRGDKTVFLIYVGNVLEKLKKYIKRNWKMYVFIIVSLMYIVIVVFVYRVYIIKKVYAKDQIQYIKSANNNENIVIDKNNNGFLHIIKLEKNELSSFDYNIKILNSNNKAIVHVKVTDVFNDYIYHDRCYQVNRLKDGLWNIFMDSEFTNSEGEKIMVCLELIDPDDTKIEFVSGEKNGNSVCIENGVSLRILPEICVNYSDNDFIMDLYWIICILIYVLVIIAYYSFVIKKHELETIYLPIVMLLGLIYLLIIPIYTVPDEYTHIDSAYYVSNGILGIKKGDKLNHFYKRSVDVKNDMYSESKAKPSIYRSVVTDRKSINTTEFSEAHARFTFGNSGFLYYIPSAIGITLGRLLNCSNTVMLLLGRMFNLLAFSLLSYFAICKSPIGKEIIFLVGCNPIVLQEAASFSYDSIINGLAFLYFAFIVYCISNKDKIKNKDLIMVLLLVFLLASVKGGVYLPLCLMILLISYKKIKKISFTSVLLFLFVILAYSKNNIAGIVKRLLVSQNENINGFNGNEMYTLSYVITHPAKFLMLIINTIVVEGDDYLRGILGGDLGVMQLKIPWFVLIISFLLICMSVGGGVDYRIKCGEKIWLFICSCMSILLILLSMLVAFTPKSYDYIEGVQGRYFIPIIPFILFLLSTIPYRISDKSRILFIYCINHILVFMYIIMIAVKW